jgi:hypothetical protein
MDRKFNQVKDILNIPGLIGEKDCFYDSYRSFVERTTNAQEGFIKKFTGIAMKQTRVD